MLIGFLGCPCSGKTTTAALTFADLKNIGISAEFVPEQARLHIAIKKYLRKINASGTNLALDDEDQVTILQNQFYTETVFNSTESVVITDSCTYNTLLYLSPEAAASDVVQDFISKSSYDLLFYCRPVSPPTGVDPNRVHDYVTSLRIDEAIPELINQLGLQVVPLFGDAQQRHQEVTKTILEKMVR